MDKSWQFLAKNGQVVAKNGQVVAICTGVRKALTYNNFLERKSPPWRGLSSIRGKIILSP